MPTIDVRADYLEAGTGDLTGEADVVRLGSEIGVAGVFTEETHVADVLGVYWTG